MGAPARTARFVRLRGKVRQEWNACNPAGYGRTEVASVASDFRRSRSTPTRAATVVVPVVRIEAVSVGRLRF